MEFDAGLYSVRLHPDGDAWTYRLKDSDVAIRIALPALSIEGRFIRGSAATATGSVVEVEKPRILRNGVQERTWEWSVSEQPDVRVRCTVRFAPQDPVLRFKYAWRSSRPARLTKLTDGSDAMELLHTTDPSLTSWTEVRLGEFQELVHSYTLREERIPTHALEAGTKLIGPIVVASDRAAASEGRAVLWAYEHGSTVPDAYLVFQTGTGGDLSLRAIKGNYLSGHDIGASGGGIETVWLQVGAVATGGVNAMAQAYREFCRQHLSENLESRQPYIFYNTWNHQERLKNWHGKPYLTDMHETRMLAEIDRAHRMGIDVFVIDTGWYEKTGDWRVNEQRFPGNLQSIKAELDRRGMKLGLWFDNAAALSSRALERHRECVMSKAGKSDDPKPIWETEAAHRMCLVSRYWEAFADELIRLHREVGVSYFKWDAIGQYGCDSPDHDHGTAHQPEQERAERYSFLLPLYLAKIVDRVCAACPEAIVDFDLTEGGRIAGLAFLSSAKFFLINNGPYIWNYDLPTKRIADGNANLFFHPGPARTWVCRTTYTIDRWIPANLFLTHYLPDDGAENQINGIASLILGHNGIWGDLLSVSDTGVALFGEWLDAYKQVRDAIAAASPVRFGVAGGSPEIHEKIDLATGRGAIVAFATQPGEYEYVVASPQLADVLKQTDGVHLRRSSDGTNANIRFSFKIGQHAQLMLFGKAAPEAR